MQLCKFQSAVMQLSLCNYVILILCSLSYWFLDLGVILISEVEQEKEKHV